MISGVVVGVVVVSLGLVGGSGVAPARGAGATVSIAPSEVGLDGGEQVVLDLAPMEVDGYEVGVWVDGVVVGAEIEPPSSVVFRAPTRPAGDAVVVVQVGEWEGSALLSYVGAATEAPVTEAPVTTAPEPSAVPSASPNPAPERSEQPAPRRSTRPVDRLAVDPLPEPAAPHVPERLARTGSTQAATAQVGLVAVVLGAVLVRAGRRPRRVRG